jgi:hypothetical protein
VTVNGDPTMRGICSCLECQKLTGSAFYYHGYWPKSAARTDGQSTVWRRSSEAGRWVDSYFCPICGSAVYSYAEFDPDSICVSIGSFAAPSFPSPQYSIWERHKHPWVEAPQSCEKMDTQP